MLVSMVTCRRCTVDEWLSSSLEYVPFRGHNKNTQEKKEEKKEKHQLISLACKNKHNVGDARMRNHVLTVQQVQVF